MLRKTKIVATVGPACSDKETIKKLIECGMDAARLNFSHGDYASHETMIKTVKEARRETDVPVPLILDTKGPEIRIKTFKDGAIELKTGSKFILTTDDVEGDETRVSITYTDLPNDVVSGNRILLDDGLIELKVEAVKGSDIICTVLNDGPLKNNKGVNVPDVSLNLPTLTEKDINDIVFGIKMGVDFIAASFIRSSDDIVKIKQVLDRNGGSRIKIIAKIENREGLDNLDAILDAAHGIMVARGDLGVEIMPEEVPIVQKDMIKKANKKGKTVITATQMLDSMMNNPRPTRAEANDVANAIFDGTDAIMLSGETASGKYPVESVSMMARIAKMTEASMDKNIGVAVHDINEYKTSITDAISYATCTTAADLKASLIVNVTFSGFTSRMVAKFRPACPILAITASQTVYRQMSLIHGCAPILCEDCTDLYDDVFEYSLKYAEQSGYAKPGDMIVIVAGVPVGMAGTTNTIRVATVGNILLKGEAHQTLEAKTLSGRVCAIKSVAEAKEHFRAGDILVCRNTNADLTPFIRTASAIIVGANEPQNYDHAKTTTEALDIPLLICQENVCEKIPTGIIITIDGQKGIIYNGKREV
ncbi:MAG: pyruvate kinase [Defluviitaleaceae bacterium]|nr:pyruvate kinase [Defluviitaleaceae bacterium]